MLIFKTVRYKNFLSSGNYFITIPLNVHKTTCVIGSNGSGKSQLISAITFALYGKGFKNVVKNALINSQNKKNCLVELEFSNNNKEYKIIRGIKPTIFEIYDDNGLINQESSSRDYQEYLEKYILRMTFKSFSQIVVLGSTSYIPFMELIPADRRIIIEDLLDIQIFSTMAKIIKERISSNTTNIDRIKHDIALTKQKYEIHKKHLVELQENVDLEIQTYQDEQIVNNNNITKLLDENDIITEKNNKLQNDIAVKLHIENKHKQFLKLETQFEYNIIKLTQDSSFYTNTENCPTCKQKINDEFRFVELEKISSKIERQQTGIVELKEKIKDIENKVSEINKIQQEIYENQSLIYSNNSTISFLQQTNKKIQEKIIKLQEPNKLDDGVLLVIENELNNFILEYEKLTEEKLYLDTGVLLLKENGVKAKIVGNYLPIINKLINKYLEEFDFFVNFNLNEEFKEEIKARYKDVFSYHSFSDGEKMRINLSILQTWRQISRMRNSVNTNLLIIDELVDNGLDSFGMEIALGLVSRLGNENNNVFVLSPKGELYADKFDHVIKFEKVKGFSKMVSD